MKKPANILFHPVNQAIDLIKLLLDVNNVLQKTVSAVQKMHQFVINAIPDYF